MTHGGQVCMTSNRKWKTLDIVTNTSYDINDSMILKKSCRVILLNVSPSQVDLFNPGSERTTVAVRYKHRSVNYEVFTFASECSCGKCDVRYLRNIERPTKVCCGRTPESCLTTYKKVALVMDMSPENSDYPSAADIKKFGKMEAIRYSLYCRMVNVLFPQGCGRIVIPTCLKKLIREKYHYPDELLAETQFFGVEVEDSHDPEKVQVLYDHPVNASRGPKKSEEKTKIRPIADSRAAHVVHAPVQFDLAAATVSTKSIINSGNSELPLLRRKSSRSKKRSRAGIELR
eukprot:933107_1